MPVCIAVIAEEKEWDKTESVCLQYKTEVWSERKDFDSQMIMIQKISTKPVHNTNG